MINDLQIAHEFVKKDTENIDIENKMCRNCIACN